MWFKIYKLTAPGRHGPNNPDEVLIFGLVWVMKITFRIDRICKRSFGNCMTASPAVSELVSFKMLMVPGKYKCKCKQGKLPTERLGSSEQKQINLDHTAL